MDGKEKIDFEDFGQLLWAQDGGVSELIVSNRYLNDENNLDYINEITYELYQLYNKERNLSIRVLSRILETTISLSRKFHISHLKLLTDAT